MNFKPGDKVLRTAECRREEHEWSYWGGIGATCKRCRRIEIDGERYDVNNKKSDRISNISVMAELAMRNDGFWQYMFEADNQLRSLDSTIFTSISASERRLAIAKVEEMTEMLQILSKGLRTKKVPVQREGLRLRWAKPT